MGGPGKLYLAARIGGSQGHWKSVPKATGRLSKSLSR